MFINLERLHGSMATNCTKLLIICLKIGVAPLTGYIYICCYEMLFRAYVILLVNIIRCAICVQSSYTLMIQK